MKFNGIILAAHRGDRKRFPENTLPAFSAAIKSGADMIETDVQMSKDGVMIIMHDDNTVRTTGTDGVIGKMTLKEIKQLDAGAWFSNDFKKTEIPTVSEFIELIKDTNILINWELKDYPCVCGDDFAFKSADKLIELIEENGLGERSMVNSFSNRLLEHIYLRYGHKYPIHGQGINACSQSNDRAETPEKTLFDWCCLYSEKPGMSPLDFGGNFEYCVANNIYPCVCLNDTEEIYAKALKLGCKMFTSNDIHTADKILKALNVR